MALCLQSSLHPLHPTFSRGLALAFLFQTGLRGSEEMELNGEVPAVPTAAADRVSYSPDDADDVSDGESGAAPD